MLFISAVCACEGMSHQKTGYSTGSLLAVSMMVIHACEMINKSPSFARLDTFLGFFTTSSEKNRNHKMLAC